MAQAEKHSKALSATGATTITFRDPSFRPNFCLVTAGVCTLCGTDHYAVATGIWAAKGTQWCTSVRKDSGANSDAESNIESGFVLMLHDDDGTDLLRVSITSVVPGTATLDVDAISAGPYAPSFLFAEFADAWASPKVVSGRPSSMTFTDAALDFTGTALIASTVDTQVLTTNVDTAKWSLGIATTGLDASQGCISMAAVSGADTWHSQMFSGRVLSAIAEADGALSWDARLTRFGNGSVELEFPDTMPGTRYLGLAVVRATAFSDGLYTYPTSNITVDDTAPGFRPACVIELGALTTDGALQTSAFTMVGSASNESSVREGCVYANGASQDGDTLSPVNSTHAIDQENTSAVPQVSANISFIGAGVRRAFDVTSLAYRGAYLCLGEHPSDRIEAAGVQRNRFSPLLLREAARLRDFRRY